MMCMLLKIRRNIVFNRAFHRINVFARRNARAIANPKDMGVDGLGGLMPPHVQNHIGGLAPDAGQGLQGRA